MAESNNPLIAAYLRDLAAVINEIEQSANPEMVKAGLTLVDRAPENLRTMLRLKSAGVKV